jgi:peptide/nickel transport system substrate-binding protein
MKPNTPYDNNSSANGAAKWYPSAGPYYIAARNIATGVTVLKRNKFYHGPKAANPDQIKFIAYSDQSTAINDTKAGVVNVDMAGWPGALAGQLKQEFGAHTVSGAHGATKGAGGQLHFEQTDCIDFFTFNTAKAPTNNVNVRKALEFGLDRTGALSILGAGAGTTADQILTPPVPGYHHFTIYTRRPNFAKAKQVGGSALANAGTFQFWHSTSGTRTRQAAFLENDLRALGLKYQDDIIQPTTYYEQLGHRGTTYNIARAGWCADYYDPFDYLNVLFDGNSIVAELNNDLSYIDSPALNKQLEKAATIGGAKRNKVYGNLDREIMAKYAPYFPYELDYARMLTSKNMHNWTYDAFQGSPAINALAVG